MEHVSMSFELPQIYEIETTVDNRLVTGAYAFVLGLTVYYKGYAENVSKPASEEDIPDLARQILADLYLKRAREMGQPPDGLPEALREAASEFLDSYDDEAPIRDLVKAFGDTTAGIVAHCQVSCLLINMLTPIVPFWTEMCDDNIPVTTHKELLERLNQRSFENADWERLETIAVARRDGEIIGDCDACRAEPIAEAVACCAKFIRTG